MGFSIKSTRRAFLGAFLAVGAVALVGVNGQQALAADIQKHWVLDGKAALDLVANGAIVLDTRDPSLKDEQPLANAQPVVWQDFTNPDLPDKGKLLSDDAALNEKLQKLGISGDKPVISIADTAKGWGEDGRITWMLRTLGHKKAYLVDGGIAALTANGDPKIQAVGAVGDFTVSRSKDFEITKEELVSRLGADNLVILDTREPREYAGETPYGESRGGHVPGAKHIFYKDLVGADGHILPADQLKARLKELGVKEDTEVVSYCTGGIRSGFVTAVLNNAGVKARNYAGSMWEWSAQSPDQYPLTTN